MAVSTVSTSDDLTFSRQETPTDSFTDTTLSQAALLFGVHLML